MCNTRVGKVWLTLLSQAIKVMSRACIAAITSRTTQGKREKKQPYRKSNLPLHLVSSSSHSLLFTSPESYTTSLLPQASLVHSLKKKLCLLQCMTQGWAAVSPSADDKCAFIKSYEVRGLCENGIINRRFQGTCPY